MPDLNDPLKDSYTGKVAEGLLGKDHDLTVKLRGLRTGLLGNRSPGGTPPPGPAHAAGKP